MKRFPLDHKIKLSGIAFKVDYELKGEDKALKGIQLCCFASYANFFRVDAFWQPLFISPISEQPFYAGGDGLLPSTH